MFPTPWISNLPEAIPHDRHRQSFSFKRGSPDNPTGNGNAPVAEGDQVGRMSEANEPRSGRKSLRGCVFDCRAMPNPFWDETLRDESVCDFFSSFRASRDCKGFKA